MEHLVARLGAPRARTEQVDSPFDYEHHLEVFIAADAPEPTPNNTEAYTQYLVDMVTHCALEVNGGSLVLFTSYGEMQRVARLCATHFHASSRPFLIQGEGAPRSVLTKQFQKAGNGILFGTDSFWTGVDVPGSALSQVIIARLPFKNPSHPLLEAKHEWIRDHGGSPFVDMTLPDALIQFRQGIGRLIRNQQDRGVLTLLDGRLLKKPYGRQFISILPKNNFTRLTRENRIHVFPQGNMD
ncbi:MAG TPA: hypothetical protein DIU37_01165 [Opitutae bacterium]|nr:hypothetical protein [Opitutae bacterium]